jgi:predicted dienelactone hydrolase
VTHDPRIKAAVIADPLTVFFTPNSFGAVGIPVQLWASELGGDGVLPHTTDIVDQSLPSKHEYRVVPNAGHFAFLAPCPPALAKEVPQICVDANGFDRVAFHRQFNADVARILSDTPDERTAMKQEMSARTNRVFLNPAPGNSSRYRLSS